MTEKRFMVDDAGSLIDMEEMKYYDIVEEVCPVLNEQHETITTQKHIIDKQEMELSKVENVLQKHYDNIKNNEYLPDLVRTSHLSELKQIAEELGIDLR
jgi:DNA-directed RNA polymerase alpha subunit